MPSAFLVPANTPRPPAKAEAEAGARAAGRVLHLYENGTAVVEAPSGAGQPGEPVATAGLCLPAAAEHPSALHDARRSIEDAVERAGPEHEDDIAAYVEFVAPPDPRWLASLRDLRVRLIAYQPDNSYLVRGRRSDLAGVAAAVHTSEGGPAIRSVTELTSELKPAPKTLGEHGEDTVVVLAATADEHDRALAAVRAVPGVQLQPGAGNDVIDSQRVRVRARVGDPGLAALLELPQVLSVERFRTAVPEDEIAGLVIAGQLDTADRPSGSYDAWLTDHHVDGSGAVIGVVDGGVDVSHPAFAGRIRDLADGAKDWHATMVAGHAAGAYRAERDPGGFTYGLGTAPAASLLSQDRERAARELCAQTAAEAGAAFAVQNNSWGRGSRDPMDYSSEEAVYDLLVRNAAGAGGPAAPLTVCFSSGNSGAQGLTRPKGAKNVIVTGNSENYRPDAGGVDSDDVRDVYTGSYPSSHGNCGDGRIRPHVVAPGEWTASANFDTALGQPDYVSPLIAWGGGSSGASPKTAGACALLAQWWRRWHAGADPSPAMLRALVVNGAEPVTTGGPIPNNVQGWGRLSLRELLDPGVARVALDQKDVLTRPGDTRQWSVRVVDPRRPVKVTLAWTDPPGAVGTGTATASAVVNRLALRVADGARTWRGGADRFRGGWTATDAELAGAPHLRDEGADNLQCVFLAPGQAHDLGVSVTALAVTADALTGGYDTPQQDFALVVTNAEIDRSATTTTVVTGFAAVGDVAPQSRPPRETAWWAAGEEVGPGGPGSQPEGQRAVTTALESAGNAFDTVSTAGPGLAGVAGALYERLAAQGAGGAAVLGVPAGTVVTSAGVDALRALAEQTGLHLVSDDTALLARLAAAVGPHTGVRYRLADGPGGLSGPLREAALEAGGMQQIVLGPASLDGASATLRFGITPSDGALVVTLPAGISEVSVLRPGLAAVALGVAEVSAAGMRTVPDGEWIHLVVEHAGDHPGAWTLRASVGQAASAASATAWVHGGAQLTVRAPEVAPGRRLLSVAADPGSLLRQVSLPPSRLTPASSPAPERDRPLVIRARPSRAGGPQDDGEQPEAAGVPVPVPALGQVVDVSADAPTVLDVPLDVVGVDSHGTAFARRARASMVAAPGRRTDAGAAPPLLVTGRIDALRYRDGSVVGVRVTDGRYARELAVSSTRLGTAIEAMDHHEPVVLSVQGTELESVLPAYEAATPPVH
jgi:hypothetical protein